MLYNMLLHAMYCILYLQISLQASLDIATRAFAMDMRLISITQLIYDAGL